MTDSLRTIPDKLANLEPVRGNSMSAGFEPDGLYWVVSYSTPIAVYDPTDGTLYVNDYSYSVTTSRHSGTLYRLARWSRYEVDVTPSDYSSSAARRALRDAVEANRPALTAATE